MSRSAVSAERECSRVEGRRHPRHGSSTAGSPHTGLPRHPRLRPPQRRIGLSRMVAFSVLQQTASLFGPCRVVREPSCPGGRVDLNGTVLTDNDLIALAWGVKGGMVTVRFIQASEAAALGLEGVGDLYVTIARQTSIFSTPPTRMLYAVQNGSETSLRVLNFKVGVQGQQMGRGVSTLALGRQLATALRLGVDVVDVIAVGGGSSTATGYSVWPRLGYGGVVPAAIWAALPPPDLQALGYDPAVPVDIRVLCSTQAGWQLWAQHGRGFNMRFSLSQGDSYANHLISCAAEVGL